jgi:hypothetical protein
MRTKYFVSEFMLKIWKEKYSITASACDAVALESQRDLDI